MAPCVLGRVFGHFALAVRSVRHTGRYFVPEHVHLIRLFQLVETRRLAVGSQVNVQHVERRRATLRRDLQRDLRRAPQLGHLLRRQQLPSIGPSLGPSAGAGLGEPPPRFEDLEALAMLHRRRHRRAGRKLGAKVQRHRSHVCLRHRPLALGPLLQPASAATAMAIMNVWRSAPAREPGR